jgi:hypothetical protein
MGRGTTIMRQAAHGQVPMRIGQHDHPDQRENQDFS